MDPESKNEILGEIRRVWAALRDINTNISLLATAVSRLQTSKSPLSSDPGISQGFECPPADQHPSSDASPDLTSLGDVSRPPSKPDAETEKAAGAKARPKRRRKEAGSQLHQPVPAAEPVANVAPIAINPGRQPEYFIAPEISAVIMPHQIEGVRFLWSSMVDSPDGLDGCVLADSMGLGKTLQTIAFVQAYLASGNGRTCLLVAPATVLPNWDAEMRRWLAPQHALSFVSISNHQQPLPVHDQPRERSCTRHVPRAHAARRIVRRCGAAMRGGDVWCARIRASDPAQTSTSSYSVSSCM
eukprot:TRINITY_DN33462_c0_g1_i1.p1 TRINITY_DN33462_c0_g1~~TRINITY_DN33462_c0_g1_i1.p1  ORF type:complete len:300 (-),score=37.48 TRINITY_DN33462_c0_g1_i1:39-938(-)